MMTLNNKEGIGMARKISTQIQFDPDMYEAIKALAESKGWSMAQIVRLALQEYLAKNKEEGK